jgi:hypothetical protein
MKGSTFTEEQGIKAVIDLQSMINKTVTKEAAKISWNSFAPIEKLQTEHAWNIFFGNNRN